ncbi:MAG TPA: saccharopine dehydrogenase C-terminal domain-containing protein [Acidimicrobiia bacterium]|nr:saccharopine dehydrogenase C-terminal domain-containing protein [Acidimicrobiia bacterium]
MRVLVVGAGGVGAAIARAAAPSAVFEHVVMADLDPARARAAVERCDDARFVARPLDASDRAAISELARAERIDVVVNACDPRLNPAIFAATFDAGCNYVDMAMTLSEPHPDRPHEEPGVLLGAEQFAASDAWAERGQLALVGMGVEPGLSDVFARYAADHLFSAVDEIGVRDGGDLVIEGYGFAPTFSVWTTIEECLNPPLVWERDRGWFTTAPFSEPEVFEFPEGIGPIECVNVEHEEVLLIPRWIDCRRVTFKYGLGVEFIDVLRVLDKTGLASTRPVRVRGVDVAPRDLVAAVLPDPATLGERMRGRTCAGTWVTGTGKDGRPLEVYLYHVSDNTETMAWYGAQAVVWQTAVNPVVALEMLASGAWQGAGVLGPEAFDAVPFLDRLRDRGEEWKIDVRATRGSTPR